jgi:hypothetical protein
MHCIRWSGNAYLQVVIVTAIALPDYWRQNQLYAIPILEFSTPTYLVSSMSGLIPTQGKLFPKQSRFHLYSYPLVKGKKAITQSDFLKMRYLHPEPQSTVKTNRYTFILGRLNTWKKKKLAKLVRVNKIGLLIYCTPFNLPVDQNADISSFFLPTY